MRILLNTKAETIPDDLADEPLLFVLRDHFGLSGPKFGCGVGPSWAASASTGSGERRFTAMMPQGPNSASRARCVNTA